MPNDNFRGFRNQIFNKEYYLATLIDEIQSTIIYARKGVSVDISLHP